MKEPFEGLFRAGCSRSSGRAIVAAVALLVSGLIVVAMYKSVPSDEHHPGADGSPQVSPLANTLSPSSPSEGEGDAMPSRLVSGAAAASESPNAPRAVTGQQQQARHIKQSADARELRLAEFAELMHARMDAAEKTRASLETLAAARATSGVGAKGAETATGQAYRKAALAVEAALDAHPDIQALQAQHDELQEQKRERSKEMAAILDAWRSAQRSSRRDFDSTVQRLSEDIIKQQQALLKSGSAKSPAQLSSADKQRYQELQATLTNTLTEAASSFRQSITPEAVQAQREADGSRKQFDALKAELAEIELKQGELKKVMLARRDALRVGASEIAALQEAARAASHTHAMAAQARPEVAQALAWVREDEARQRTSGEQAYALYNSILSEFPDLREDLDALARQGGLVLAGQGIRMASGQAAMTVERKHE
jgi:hypothetical protein